MSMRDRMTSEMHRWQYEPRTSNQRAWVFAVILLAAMIASGLTHRVGYWPGMGIFLAGLLVVMAFNRVRSQRRGLR